LRIDNSIVTQSLLNFPQGTMNLIKTINLIKAAAIILIVSGLGDVFIKDAIDNYTPFTNEPVGSGLDLTALAIYKLIKAIGSMKVALGVLLLNFKSSGQSLSSSSEEGGENPIKNFLSRTSSKIPYD